MHALTRATMGLVLCACSACATVPVPRIGSTRVLPDSTGTLWGDEYESPVEALETSRPSRGMSAEWVDGSTQSARVDAHAQGASVRVRSSPRGDLGSVVWRGSGPLREIALGHVAPALAEGALAGDASASADLRAPVSRRTEGLRMQPASAVWEAARGIGVACAAGSFRVSAGACEAHDDPARRFAFAGVERGAGGLTVGVSAGARVDHAISPAGVSVHVTRADDVTFTSAEVAVANGSARSIARVVAGDNAEWSAIAIAGAGPARDEPLVFARRERWGGALERRDAWGWGASRAGVSSLTRRDDALDVRRRRGYWDGTWRVSPGVRLELAARLTREQSERRSSGALAGLPSSETADDWRARATLRSQQRFENGWDVENAYRLEWVQGRSGRPGTVAMWSLRVRAGPLDAGVSATAHALHLGQVAYQPDPAPLATAEYATLAGKGAAISASFRVWLRRHAWLGTTWSRRAPAEARMWLTLGVRTQVGAPQKGF